jgi:DnaJ-class molecular chaperone
MASEDDRDAMTDDTADPGSEPPDHRRRCPECRGRKMLPGMARTEGQGMGSKYGPCPTCDGLGYVTDEAD